MKIERERGDVRRRFGILHPGMLAAEFGAQEEADQNICFATSSMSKPGARVEDEDERAKARAEDDDDPPSSKEPPSSKDDDDEEEDRGRDIPTKCKSCGVENTKDSHFCKGCGGSMATESEDDEDEEEDDEDDKSAGAHPPPPERMQAPRKMSSEATLASILGASSESPLALKTAAIKLRQIRDTAAGITGKDDASEIVGGLLAVPEKLARGDVARVKLDALRAKNDEKERWALADRLVAAAPHMRSKVLKDLVDAEGKRVTDPKTKRSVRIRSTYGRMDLGVLRGLVTDLEGDKPKKRRAPFEPDREKARETALTGQHGTIEERVERAKKHPKVIAMHAKPGNTLSIEAIAKSFVAKNFDVENGARI